MPLGELSPTELGGIILGSIAGFSGIFYGVKYYMRRRREITPKEWDKAMEDAANGNVVSIGNTAINSGGYKAIK